MASESIHIEEVSKKQRASLAEIGAALSELLKTSDASFSDGDEVICIDLQKVGLSQLPLNMTAAKGFLNFGFNDGSTYFTAPFEMSYLWKDFDVDNIASIKFPEYVGVINLQEKGKQEIRYLYELPRTSRQVGAEPNPQQNSGNILSNANEMMETLKNKNQHINPSIFNNWKSHWSYDTKGELILVMPYDQREL